MKSAWTLAAAIICLAAADAAAGTIAVYDFEPQPGNEASVPVTTHISGATFGDITRGGGIAPDPGMHSINSRDWDVGTGYYSFVVTPDAGTTLHLSQLVYTDRRSTAEGPPNIAVEFSTQPGFAGPTTIATYTLADAANPRETLDLSGFGPLADLTSAVEFRIFATGTTDGRGTYRLGREASAGNSGLPAALELLGPTAVPEPGGILLLGLGLAGAVLTVGFRTDGAGTPA